MSGTPVLTINVGNSRTQFARFEGQERRSLGSLPNSPSEGLLDALLAEIAALRDEGEKPVAIIASVNRPVSQTLERSLLDAAPDAEVLVAGRDFPIDITHSLDASGEQTVGQDRLFNAIGAYALRPEASVIVDAGTAVTVDFIDGQGVFHGGAIAPGARMMLGALHEKTSALPEVPFAAPVGVGEADDLEPFGKNTPEAMLNGVFFAIRGLVRLLTERYAEKYEAYPRVVVTGGDAQTIFGSDELIDAIVHDLTLRGIGASFESWLRTLDDSDDEPAPHTEARDLDR
ncbi:MAG: type III pantothenate kinase [Phycisphaeraceae bacterium]|nr:type III pantothenate kinase [Phycisphaeraceae bacterium]